MEYDRGQRTDMFVYLTKRTEIDEYIQFRILRILTENTFDKRLSETKSYDLIRLRLFFVEKYQALMIVKRVTQENDKAKKSLNPFGLKFIGLVNHLTFVFKFNRNP